MSFESIDPSIQRDMTGLSADAAKLLNSLPPIDESTADGINPDIYSLAARSHGYASTLAGVLNILDSNAVPAMSQSMLDIDQWQNLEEGYNTLNELGQQPEFVFAPEGRSLTFWKNVYSNLRKFQDDNRPDAKDRLLSVVRDGILRDGLDIPSNIRDQWDGGVVSTFPRWRMTVMPTTPSSMFQDADSDGVGRNGIPNPDIEKLKKEHPKFMVEPPARDYIEHPSAETYLFAQALRLFRADEVLDRKGYTFLDLRLNIPNTHELIPVSGDWYEDYGCVMLRGISGTYLFNPVTRPVVSEILP